MATRSTPVSGEAPSVCAKLESVFGDLGLDGKLWWLDVGFYIAGGEGERTSAQLGSGWEGGGRALWRPVGGAAGRFGSPFSHPPLLIDSC